MRKNTHCMIIAARASCAAMTFSCIGVFADTGDGDASVEGSTVQQDQDTSQTGTDQTAADGFVSVERKGILLQGRQSSSPAGPGSTP